METTQKERFKHEIRPYVKELVEEIFVESIKKGEMRELLEDLALARSMEEVEGEEALSYNEAVKQIHV